MTRPWWQAILIGLVTPLLIVAACWPWLPNH